MPEPGTLVNWDSLHVGQRISMVVHMVCRNLEEDEQFHISQSVDKQAKKVLIRGAMPDATMVALLNVSVSSLCPVEVRLDGAASTVPIPPCQASDLVQVVELCSGLGAWSSIAHRVRLSARVGVDHNPIWESLFRTLHPGTAAFICGDLAASDVIHQLSSKGCHHGVLVAGVSCQPHSALGDRKSMQDDRAASLPKALYVAWMLQSAIVALECVPSVLTDPAFQEVLKRFVTLTGFQLCQTVLKLSDSWCSRRDRWFGVLSAPILGSFELPAMPAMGLCSQVSALFPEFPCVDKADLEQIQLNLYELSKYHAYAVNGIEHCYLDLTGHAPTLLHSAGNQMYVCACGCRQALSEARLQSRGLVGILIPLGTFQKHMHINMQHCRYLHPAEMFALLGGSPSVDFGPNLRLAMAGIGRRVAPMTALWTFAHIRKLIDGFLGLPPCAPAQVLFAYAQEVLQECNEKWPRPTAPLSAGDDSNMQHDKQIEHGSDEDVGSGSGFHISVRWHQESTTHEVVCNTVTTARQVLQAEKALVGQHVPDLVWVAGELMYGFGHCIEPRHCVGLWTSAFSRPSGFCARGVRGCSYCTPRRLECLCRVLDVCPAPSASRHVAKERPIAHFAAARTSLG